MAVTVTAVSLDTVKRDGGYLIDITGVFTLTTQYRVHIGAAGDSSDPACVSGIAGRGSVLLPFTATTLRCYTPVNDAGGPYDIYVADLDTPDSGVLAAAITFVEPDYASAVFALRSVLPPYYKTGPRSMAALAEL